MNVKLVSTTESLIVEKDLSPEELIVYTARVSNPNNQLNTETSDKLLRYLIKHKHWSPFEMVDMTVEIKTSRSIAAQILRHRSFSFQEFSQRYSTVSEFEKIELRKQSEKNRQSSVDLLADYNIEYLNSRINSVIRMSEELYLELLSYGVARECARDVLPLCTQTTLYMKGSVRSWIHYLQVRCDPTTQLEHRLIAEEIKKIFSSQFPMIAELIKDELI